MVEFATPTPPSIPEIEAHASNESTMNDHYRFAQVVLSLPYRQGVDADFDLGVEQGDSDQFDGPHTRFVLYADSTLWCYLMMMKDL